jgi:predicted metalloprotease
MSYLPIVSLQCPLLTALTRYHGCRRKVLRFIVWTMKAIRGLEDIVPDFFLPQVLCLSLEVDPLLFPGGSDFMTVLG